MGLRVSRLMRRGLLGLLVLVRKSLAPSYRFRCCLAFRSGRKPSACLLWRGFRRNLFVSRRRWWCHFSRRCPLRGRVPHSRRLSSFCPLVLRERKVVILLVVYYAAMSANDFYDQLPRAIALSTAPHPSSNHPYLSSSSSSRSPLLHPLASSQHSSYALHSS
jgi:hypothetical protein